MTDLEAARAQMSMSLAFHILFAMAGMAMPMFMLLAGIQERRTGDRAYRQLFERWAKGTAILFAVGAVSGTVLSFELGLLWPRFMEVFGPVVGLAFSLEGFAFFLEAIFLGLLLYGGDKISPNFRLFSAVIVALSGLASGVFVTAVNAFMHTPTGVTLNAEGGLAAFSPWGPFAASSFPTQALHVALSAYSSLATLVLGVHAWRLLRAPGSRFHHAAIRIALGVGLVAVPLQALSGDLSAKHLAREQPLKLAAAEGLFETTAGASLTIGGWPDAESRTLRGAIHVPRMLSVLAFADPDATVQGLEAFPRREWPSLPLVHLAFQLMVACGSLMLLVMALTFWSWRRNRGRFEASPWILRLAALTAPLGLVAVEAGWVVTEAGRQPWIVRGLMTVEEAVAPISGLSVSLILFSALYGFLGLVVLVMMRAHVLGVEAVAVEVEA